MVVFLLILCLIYMSRLLFAFSVFFVMSVIVFVMFLNPTFSVTVAVFLMFLKPERIKKEEKKKKLI